jgi:preprotein translocase subunit SecG
MFFVFLLVLHVIICVLLIVSVLLQSSKGGGLSGAFGGMGGAAQTMFGGRGTATFLSKATSVLAALFFVVCLGMVFATRLDKPVSAVQQELKRKPAASAQGSKLQQAPEKTGK